MTTLAPKSPPAVVPEPKDTFSLRIVKLNTYITRSKWMLGVYAGLILLLSNETIKNKELENKIIITISILGVVLLSFAVVNFEQHLVEIRKALYEGKKGKSEVDINEVTYNAALKFFGWNLRWTGLVGLTFICFLWFSWISPTRGKTLLNLSGVFYYQTKASNPKYPATKHSLTLNADSSFVLNVDMFDSLKLTRQFSQTGRWLLNTDSIIYCTGKDSSFRLRIVTDKILLPMSQSANDNPPYLFEKKIQKSSN